MTLYPHKQSIPYAVRFVVDPDKDESFSSKPHELGYYRMRDHMIDNLLDRLYPGKYEPNEMHQMMHKFYNATRGMTKDNMRQAMLSYNKFIKNENTKWKTGLRTGVAIMHYRKASQQPQHIKAEEE